MALNSERLSSAHDSFHGLLSFALNVPTCSSSSSAHRPLCIHSDSTSTTPSHSTSNQHNIQTFTSLATTARSASIDYLIHHQSTHNGAMHYGTCGHSLSLHTIHLLDKTRKLVSNQLFGSDSYSHHIAFLPSSTHTWNYITNAYTFPATHNNTSTIVIGPLQRNDSFRAWKSIQSQNSSVQIKNISQSSLQTASSTVSTRRRHRSRTKTESNAEFHRITADKVTDLALRPGVIAVCLSLYNEILGELVIDFESVIKSAMSVSKTQNTAVVIDARGVYVERNSDAQRMLKRLVEDESVDCVVFDAETVCRNTASTVSVMYAREFEVFERVKQNGAVMSAGGEMYESVMLDAHSGSVKGAGVVEAGGELGMMQIAALCGSLEFRHTVSDQELDRELCAMVHIRTMRAFLRDFLVQELRGVKILTRIDEKHTSTVHAMDTRVYFTFERAQDRVESAQKKLLPGCGVDIGFGRMYDDMNEIGSGDVLEYFWIDVLVLESESTLNALKHIMHAMNQ